MSRLSNEHGYFDWELGWNLLVLGIVALFIIGGIVVTFMKYNVRSTVTVHVKEKTVKVDNKSSRYLIFSDNEVFQDTDAFWVGKFNSSDLYNELEVGKTYQCEAMGFRVPFFSWYKNLLHCEPVTSTNAR